MFYSLLWGNIFSLISAICLAVSAVKKSKHNLVKWLIFNTIFCILTAITLGSYPALCTEIVCMFRNILAYQKRLTGKSTALLAVLCAGIGLYVNNLGYIGYFPIIATVVYTVLLYTTTNEQQMRYTLIFTLMLWFVHDIYISAYPGAITDVVVSAWTGFFAVKYIRQQKTADTHKFGRFKKSLLLRRFNVQPRL